MRQAAFRSESCAPMPATAPVSCTSTAYDVADDTYKNAKTIDLGSADALTRKPFPLLDPLPSPARSDTAERGGDEKKKRKGAAGATTSDGSTSGPLNVNEVPLSYSSRGLDSTACTEDPGDDDVADEDDDAGENSSVGSCTVQEAELIESSASKPRAGWLAQSPTPLQPHMAMATQQQQQQEEERAPHPFSSLTTSLNSWSAMRKLRLVHAQDRPVSSTTADGSAAQSQTSDQLTARQSARVSSPTPATSAGCASPRSGNLPGNTVRFATQGGESLLSGCSTSTTSNAAGSGSWTLAPRLRGVNELLFSSAANGDTSLFHTARDAFPVWHTAVRLDLHDNSAGGTYMVRRAPADATVPSAAAARVAGEVLCVFKPRDEEIGQETNPHGNRESDRTEAFAPGSGSRREVLAYCLDHGHNAGVPPTMEVATGYGGGHGSHNGVAAERPFVASAAGLSDLSTRTLGLAQREPSTAARHPTAASTQPQIGSLQLFLPGCQEAADVLPGRFNIEEVHALAIFDIRTLNGDRHGGNVLVQHYRRARASTAASPASSPRSPEDAAAPHLVPIDHSYICPSGYADPDYEWLSWPQAKKPFSAANRAYIAGLDAEKDAELVRAALLAHSNCAATAAMATSGRGLVCGVYDGFNGSSCSAQREAYDDRQHAWAATSCASRPDCSSLQTRALLLDDGVQHAGTVAHTGRVGLDASFCGLPLSSPCDPQGGEVDFNDLTIFSPVRGAAPSWADGEEHADEEEEEDWSPRGFSTTAPPESHVSCAAQWAAATALLMDFPPCDGGEEEDKESVDAQQSAAAVPSRSVHGSCVGRHSPQPSTPPTSVASPLLTFETYTGSSDGGAAVPSRVGQASAPTVTYDRSAADAAAEVMRCTTRLLQIAALEFEMSAYAIGSLCRRPRVAQASFLEAVMEEARDEDTWEVVMSKFDAVVRHRLAAGELE